MLEDKDGRTKAISEDQFMKLLKTKFTDSLKAWANNTRFYRGSQTAAGDRLYIDPKKFTRNSISNQNYYTLIMSYDKAWSAFPPRDKCLIASTGQGTASNYGRVYHVLPENGAKIGVAPSHDIWSSFNGTLGGSHNLMPLLDMLEDEFTHVSLGQESNENIRDFKEACKKATGRIGPGHPMVIMTNMPYTKKMGLYNWVTQIFDPKKNGFKVIKAGTTLKEPDREVWTDGECLLSTYNVLHDLLWNTKWS